MPHVAATPENWERAAEAILAGEVVVVPTDTVYGIACDAFNREAILRVYELKGRSAQKALPVLISGASTLSRVAISVPRSAEQLAQVFWPGALTLVMPRQPDLPEELSGTTTIAVRMPDHSPLLSMLSKCGGMAAATSANPSGMPDAVTAEDAYTYFGEAVALVIDGGRCVGATPSTVVDCTGELPRVLREGAISAADIARAVRGPSSGF